MVSDYVCTQSTKEHHKGVRLVPPSPFLLICLRHLGIVSDKALQRLLTSVIYTTILYAAAL